MSASPPIIRFRAFAAAVDNRYGPPIGVSNVSIEKKAFT